MSTRGPNSAISACSAFKIVIMKVLVDISIVPLGVGLSLSSYIAECEKIFAASGLKTALHAYGTNVEGEWEKM